MRARAANVLANAGLVLVSLVLALGILELGLRLFWDGFYLKEGKTYATPHPTRGWRNKPGVQVPYGEPEFVVTVTHNSWGYRGPEIARERTPGRSRIFALGDSFTYGIGVQDDETFCALLEQLDPGREVINSGVNGYGTSQELLLLREEALAFEPDLVMLFLFWNDAANSYLRPIPDFRLENGALAYTPPEPVEPPVPVAAAPEPAPERRRWLRHSYAYRFLSDRIKQARFHWKLLLDMPIEDAKLSRDQQEPAWALTFALIEEMKRLTDASGSRLLVVLVPDQVQVQTDWTVTGLRREDYDVQDRLRAWSERSGVEVLDLLPGLLEAWARDQTPLYYRQDRHLTARGHRVVAELLHAHLKLAMAQ